VALHNPVEEMNKPLDTPNPDATANLSEHLSRVARLLPEKKAVVCPAASGAFVHWTFRQLDEETDRLAHGFQRAGIVRGVKTILMVRPSLELFAVTFALFRVGAIPVMIDPGMGRQKLVENLSSIGAEAFIGIPLAHILRVLSPGRFSTVKVKITGGPPSLLGGVCAGGFTQGSLAALPAGSHASRRAGGDLLHHGEHRPSQRGGL